MIGLTGSATIAYFRGGQLILLRCHFEKAAYIGGPYLLMETEASLGWSYNQLEDISDWKIFLDSFCGPVKTLWRATCGPRVAICPPLAYSLPNLSPKKKF